MAAVRRTILRRRVLHGVVAAGLTIVAASCADSDGREVRSDAPRAELDQQAVAPTVHALNAFAADLHRQLALRGGNVVSSPYAVALSLAQARLGAEGSTREELDRVLHAAPGADFDQGMSTLASIVTRRNGERSNDVRRGAIDIQAAGSLWVQLDTDPHRPFLDGLARYHDTGLRSVDFRSKPDKARTVINRWARSITGDQVGDLLPRGSVNEFTRFVVPSVASVRAPWMTRFDPQRTRLGPFTTSDGRIVDVPTMTAREPEVLATARGPGWEAVSLPYLGGELAMIVVLPDAGAFEAVEQSIDGDTLTRLVHSLRTTRVELVMPRFQLTSNLDLEQPLVALGLRSAFTEDADFSGITGDEQLSISRAAHQAEFGVDEQGTNAEAITVLRPPSGRPPAPAGNTVTIDRPFLFLVTDLETGLVLQIGRVVDPTG